MPVSQPPFCLIPDREKNKEETPFIYVVCTLRRLYSPFNSDLIPLPNRNFEKIAQDHADPAEHRIQAPSGFMPIFMGLKLFHQGNILHV